MDKKEALKHLNVSPCGDTGFVIVKAEAARLGYEALGREMAREAKAEKPKRPSLEEQEECVRKHCECKGDYSVMCFGWITGTGRVAAADTLKTLREEVVPFIQAIGGGVLELGTMATASSRAREILRKLGVEP